MSTIDITLIANHEAIIRDKAFSATGYPMLPNGGRGYILGITNWNDVNFGGYDGGYYADTQDENEGGFALDVNAEVDDVLRWRTTTLTAGFGCQFFIQSFILNSGAAILAPKGHIPESVSLPVRGSDGNIAAKQILDFYWFTTVAAKGYSSYNVQFALFGSDGGRIGGFTVDPYLAIPGRKRYAIG
jgi:hypothetical protein